MLQSLVANRTGPGSSISWSSSEPAIARSLLPRQAQGSRAEDTGQLQQGHALKRILERKLQDARTHVAKNLTEGAVLQIIVRSAEIYVIAQVEEFEPELQLLVFANGEVAAYVRIDIKVPGAGKRIRSGVPEGAQGIRDKGAGIQPLEAAGGVLCVRISQHIRPV
jgi:hypothetical protein